MITWPQITLHILQNQLQQIDVGNNNYVREETQFWNGINELPATAFEGVIDLADGEGM